MKECSLCSESILARSRADARFCSTECRHKAKRTVRTCVRCKLHHPSVGQPDRVCAPCVVYDKIRLERAELKAVVAWMFEHQTCFYCGEHAFEKEHVVPQVVQYPTWIVPSCRECNALAGLTVFVSALDKMQWLQDVRTRKYAKLIAAPDWTFEEIDDLGKNLRSKIRAAQMAKDVVSSQLKWNPLALQAMVA